MAVMSGLGFIANFPVFQQRSFSLWSVELGDLGPDTGIGELCNLENFLEARFA